MSSLERTVEAAIKHKNALIVAPPGFGKTTIALKIAELLSLDSFAVFTHRTALAQQWKHRAAEVNKSIRFYGPQTTGFPDRKEPLLFVDESHHIVADTFIDGVLAIRSDRRYGLTASPPMDRDMIKRLAVLFPVTLLPKVQHKLSPVVSFIKTAAVFKNDFDRALNFMRNELIVRYSQGRTLVLTRLKAHCLELERRGFVIWKPPNREPPAAEKIVGTFSFIGEGIHLKNLANVIIATPSESVTRLIQAIGRANQPPCSFVYVISDLDTGKFRATVESAAKSCGLLVIEQTEAVPQKRKDLVTLVKEWLDELYFKQREAAAEKQRLYTEKLRKVYKTASSQLKMLTKRLY